MFRLPLGRQRFTTEVDLTEPLELSGYTELYLASIGIKPRRCLKCFKFMIVEDSRPFHSDCDLAVKYFARHKEKNTERKRNLELK